MYDDSRWNGCTVKVFLSVWCGVCGVWGVWVVCQYKVIGAVFRRFQKQTRCVRYIFHYTTFMRRMPSYLHRL